MKILKFKKEDFDTLDCPVCNDPTKPKNVTAGPVVSYLCGECGSSWRINAEGDQTHFRVPHDGWDRLVKKSRSSI
jgi:transposase-like protein